MLKKEYIDVPGKDTLEVLTELAKSRVRLALAEAYANEPLPVCIRTSPTRGVVATKAIKAKALKLVPLSTGIVIYKEGDMNSALSLGKVFELDGCNYNASIMAPRITLSLEKADSKLFAPPYWIVEPTRDSAEANLSAATLTIPIYVDEKKHQIVLPILQNTRAIAADEVLYYHKANTQVAEISVQEDPSKGSGRGKGRGKGKSGKSAKPKGQAKPNANNKK